ncbi:MAG: SUF system NifU family Fe-S cluster assembly protein [Omnitrophica WOR_2 bacterium RIFCSPHIGHO2_02_FULL_68_15]|nr:MAG: SUF system NifU family Fe-S cluster assembly protein [Omnitrophica WOR_2 bacterium RIFCSPHIGHO2_02_FULL_68_15]
MSLTDELYREIILEHFREPRNHGRAEPADLTAQGVNPFCGDDLEVTGRLDGQTLSLLMSQGKGCSISQASASLMTEALTGKTLDDAAALAQTFKQFLLGGDGAPTTLPPALEELSVLEGVKKYPVRIKCAILAWNTFLDGVTQYRTKLAAGGGDGRQQDLSTRPGGGHPHPQPEDPAVVQETMRAALKTVIDPEINMNIVDLGLVYHTEANPQGQVRITYSLTSPGCPLGPVIQSQIQAALKNIPWVTQVQCNLVWTPPWDPKTMASDEAKMELGLW